MNQKKQQHKWTIVSPGGNPIGDYYARQAAQAVANALKDAGYDACPNERGHVDVTEHVAEGVYYADDIRIVVVAPKVGSE